MSRDSQSKSGIGLRREERERLLDRIRSNDPDLKELTIVAPFGWRGLLPDSLRQVTLQAFQAITTNASLVVLNIGDYNVFRRNRVDDAVKRALSLNTSLKGIHISTSGGLRDALDVAVASPNLETLTIRYTRGSTPSIDQITAAADVLRVDTKLRSLTIEGFRMDSTRGTAFATSFHGNQTIKTLTMKNAAISRAGAVSFVEALSRDHSLQAISFQNNCFQIDTAVRIVLSLCATPLKALSLVDNYITSDGCVRIVQVLRDNEHSFTKFELFYDVQDSPWQNKIRLDVDMLTLDNQLQAEKHTWADRFLNQDSRTRERLCFFALERAKKVDNDRFSKAPNMLFYLIKEIPDLITQSLLHGQ